MTKYPKSIELYGGIRAIIRPLCREDFEFSLGFFRRQPAEDIAYLRRDVTKREVMEQRVEEIEDGKAISIIAIADGMIVGDVHLLIDKQGWFRKTGEIRIVVDYNYRHKKLGRMLAQEIVDVAKDKGLKKIEASFMETQRGFIKTLEPIGFADEGTLKNFVIDMKGNSHDLRMMGLVL